MPDIMMTIRKIRMIRNVLRIPKIYDTWVFVAIKAIKNIPIIGGHS